MAINEILGNTNPMVHTEIACTQGSSNISIPTQPPTIDFCHCDFECEYEEMKFALPGGEDYQNDLSYLLEEVVDPAGTIVFDLYKDGSLVGSITNNTYGTYYGIGAVPNDSTTDQSLKSGFIVDWEKIYNALGGGKYYFKISVTNFSRLVEKETGKYKLRLFDEISANNTAVIKTFQNGYIQGGLDYTGLNWGLEFRVGGKLTYGVPDFEKDTYLSSGRRETQIQDQIINNYSLECDLIPSVISRQMIENSMLSNEYLIMDYNLFNDKSLTYQDISVYPEGVEEAEYFAQSTNGNFTFAFSDRIKDKVKRNYK